MQEILKEKKYSATKYTLFKKENSAIVARRPRISITLSLNLSEAHTRLL